MWNTTGALCEQINPARDLNQKCSKVLFGFHRQSRGKIDSHFTGRTVHMCLENAAWFIQCEDTSLTRQGNVLIGPSQDSRVLKETRSFLALLTWGPSGLVPLQALPAELHPVTSVWPSPGEGSRRWPSCTWEHRWLLLEGKDVFTGLDF